MAVSGQWKKNRHRVAVVVAVAVAVAAGVVAMAAAASPKVAATLLDNHRANASRVIADANRRPKRAFGQRGLQRVGAIGVKALFTQVNKADSAICGI